MLAIEIFGLISSYLLVNEFHISLRRMFVPEVDSALTTEYYVELTRAPDEVL